eukprot:9905002-Heterocapsa_arctica.AAC.1
MAALALLPVADRSGGRSSLPRLVFRSAVRSMLRRHCTARRVPCRTCHLSSMVGQGGRLPASVLPALASS